MGNSNNRDLKDNFDIHLLTSECSKEFCVRWTWNNYSQLPSDVELRTPFLQLAPECSLSLKKRDDLEILFFYLKNNTNQKIIAYSTVSIFDIDGNLWYSYDFGDAFDPYEKFDILDGVNIYRELLSLKDDILIFICNIKITKLFTTQCLSRNPTMKKYNGQQKWCEDLKILCSDRRHADITLEVDGAQVPANKAILSARSAVFERMFWHNMDEQENSSLQIDDVSLPVIQKLVEFLYTGELDAVTDFAMATGLYYAADKYEVQDLRQMCADILLSLMAVDNVTEIVSIANKHDDEYLKNQALVFLSNNINCLMESGKWNEFMTVDTKLAAQALEYCVKAIEIKKLTLKKFL